MLSAAPASAIVSHMPGAVTFGSVCTCTLSLMACAGNWSLGANWGVFAISFAFHKEVANRYAGAGSIRGNLVNVHGLACISLNYLFGPFGQFIYDACQFRKYRRLRQCH